MADTAAHLVDHVLPHAPVRQWVLAFPFRIRFLLASSPRMFAAVRGIVTRTLLGWLEQRARCRRRAIGALAFDRLRARRAQ